MNFDSAIAHALRGKTIWSRVEHYVSNLHFLVSQIAIWTKGNEYQNGYPPASLHVMIQLLVQQDRPICLQDSLDASRPDALVKNSPFIGAIELHDPRSKANSNKYFTSSNNPLHSQLQPTKQRPSFRFPQYPDLVVISA